MNLIERLEHFEKHQLEHADEYGAEVLHHARKRIIDLEEEKKHNARQLGIANTRLKKLEAWRIEAEHLITQLQSTISGYEAVMKSKELIDEAE